LTYKYKQIIKNRINKLSKNRINKLSKNNKKKMNSSELIEQIFIETVSKKQIKITELCFILIILLVMIIKEIIKLRR
jgi:S-adenosylmethionine/arginine decarboxylase-like enzyme